MDVGRALSPVPCARPAARRCGRGGSHCVFGHQNPLSYSGQVTTPRDFCFHWARNVFLPSMRLVHHPPSIVSGEKKKKIKELVLNRGVKIHLQKCLQLLKTSPVSLSKPPSRRESRESLFVCFELP